jgi:hypothetical protein
MFSDHEFASILSDFPKFELSYETMTHKKVFNHNVILAIPEGNKCFAWFTTYKDDNVCFILETNEPNKIKNISIGLTSFNDKLTFGGYGSVFYGTTFKYNGVTCFCIEDMYYYKGENCFGKSFVSRLNTLKHILQNDLSQRALTNNYIIFGLPLMNPDLLTLLKEIDLLPYKISQLKYRWFETKKIMCSDYYKPGPRYGIRSDIRPDATESNYKYKNANQLNANQLNANQLNANQLNANQVEVKQIDAKQLGVRFNDKINDRNIKQLSNAVFKITPDIQSDIYNLFVYKDGKEEFYDFAFISDYETSVLMNKLFRNIKENNNLDALEESDDEDDFENNKIDKYVYLDRSAIMNCKFNYKFKKWMPVSLAAQKERIVSYNLLSNKL